MPGIAPNNFVTTTTRQKFFPKVVDNVFTGNLLFSKLRAKARPWTGGTQLRIPTTVSQRVNVGSFAGFDVFNTNQEDVRQMFTVNPSEYHGDLAFSGIQLALNKGPEAFVNLMAEEFSDIARVLAETMGADLYLDGTANANKAIAGLNYHIDDATDVTSYQGLSRSTYSNLNATRTAQSGALSFTNLATDYDAAQRGSDSPDMIVTTPAVFSIMERLVSPTLYVNYNGPSSMVPAGVGQGTGLNMGITTFAYRGVPVYSDEQCTANNIWTINTKHLYLYELDYSNELVDSTKEGFAWTGWKRSSNQNAITGNILWAGQLVGESPRTMARRTGVTS